MTGRGQHLLRLGLDEVDFPPRIRTKRASDYTLEDIYDSEEFKGKIEIAYEYDFGDSWDHQIVFLGRTDPSARKAMDIEDDCEVVCLAGEVSIMIASWQLTSLNGPSKSRCSCG